MHGCFENNNCFIIIIIICSNVVSSSSSNGRISSRMVDTNTISTFGNRYYTGVNKITGVMNVAARVTRGRRR